MSARAITVHYEDHDTPAIITGKAGRRGWYAVGVHFGTHLAEDQHIGSDLYDPESPVTWEYTEATDEHRAIATNVGERL